VSKERVIGDLAAAQLDRRHVELVEEIDVRLAEG
jgi:hypothetical protein